MGDTWYIYYLGHFGRSFQLLMTLWRFPESITYSYILNSLVPSSGATTSPICIQWIYSPYLTDYTNSLNTGSSCLPLSDIFLEAGAPTPNWICHSHMHGNAYILEFHLPFNHEVESQDSLWGFYYVIPRYFKNRPHGKQTESMWRGEHRYFLTSKRMARNK